MENMQDGIDIVHQHPLGVARPLHMGRPLSGGRPYFFDHIVGYGSDLNTRIALANDKEVGGGVRKAAQVYRHDVLPLDILYGVHDQEIERRGIRVL